MNWPLILLLFLVWVVRKIQIAQQAYNARDDNEIAAPVPDEGEDLYNLMIEEQLE